MRARTPDQSGDALVLTTQMAQLPDPTVLILAGQRLGRVDPLAAKYGVEHKCLVPLLDRPLIGYVLDAVDQAFPGRSEEYTSELQSRENLVCRLLLAKKKKIEYI